VRRLLGGTPIPINIEKLCRLSSGGKTASVGGTLLNINAPCGLTISIIRAFYRAVPEGDAVSVGVRGPDSLLPDPASVGGLFHCLPTKRHRAGPQVVLRAP
jgi:hypothetical protein